MNKEAITLVQPRHTYAPEEGEGHVYMPGSILMPAARILEAGGKVASIQDLNLRPFKNLGESNAIGVSLLGAPYIPEVQKQIVPFLHRRQCLVLGGQVMDGLTGIQQTRLFGKETINGNNDEKLASVVGIRAEDMPSPYAVSLIRAYELVDDTRMKKYFKHEFSLYLGQGCEYHCEFCAVTHRTKQNPQSGKMVAAAEIYRSGDVVKKDLIYLVERAKRLGIQRFEIYLSNLDLFQTPQRLLEFAHIVEDIQRKHPDFSFAFRGLSTVTSFLTAHTSKKHPGAVEAMKKAGLHTIGFGIDGGTPEMWKSVGKAHNTAIKCLEAIRVAREEYGITPEVLMVFGHPKETESSLAAAVAFTQAMVDTYAAIPRPYVAKDIVPGNDYWMDATNTNRIEFLLEHPEYFQALDFAAKASSISHRNPLRTLVNKYYEKIIKIPSNTTDAIEPLSPGCDPGKVQQQNERKYDN